MKNDTSNFHTTSILIHTPNESKQQRFLFIQESIYLRCNAVGETLIDVVTAQRLNFLLRQLGIQQIFILVPIVLHVLK